MRYIPTTWVDGETPVNAENLNKLENAVQTNDAAIREINTARENGEFQGDDGKSAYQYAKDGGYTGTEEEFAKKLASDAPAGGAQSDWDAAEGEPGHVLNRPFYREIGIGTVLAETSPAFSEDMNGFALTDPISVVIGERYTVNWNGAEYTCTCVEIVEDGTPAPALGNVGAMTGGDDTGEPFVILVLPDELAAGAGYYAGVIPLDGSTTLTISITGMTEVVTPLPVKYLPELRGQKEIVLDIDTPQCSYSLDYLLGMDVNELQASTRIIYNGFEYSVSFVQKIDQYIGGGVQLQGLVFYFADSEGKVFRYTWSNQDSEMPPVNVVQECFFVPGEAHDGEALRYSVETKKPGWVSPSNLSFGSIQLQDGANGTRRLYVNNQNQIVLKDNVGAIASTFIGDNNYVTAYGAKGDGTTDDTDAFQNALASNRVVYVPGGTYKLSGELIIRDNCGLELAQDAVLNFTNTSGNCITLNRSAFLKGNHATVNVPYGFADHVVNVDTSVHDDVKDVPPWNHWSPQWKTARYLTDLNICMADENGIHHSADGRTFGTAVYISADGSATSTFIWGMDFSGLRIAGAFDYGVRAVNFNSGWNHEMRLEAFIDACKIGLSIEDCNKVYFAGSIQPRKAENGTVYAEHGIKLIRSKDVELSGSRVWDWNDTNSLWTYDKANVYQHIAMYGNCQGTILNDYVYYHIPSGFSDIRELIYTDTPSNFDSLIILQEPITRWFKPVNNEPYFYGGNGNKRLVLKEEQDALFQTDYIPTFTNLLATASDGLGGIFNEIGYKHGCYWEQGGSTLGNSNYTTCTGFIPCKRGSTICVKGMSFNTGNDNCRIILYDSSFEKIMHINRDNIISDGSYYYLTNYTETEDGFTVQVASTGNTVNVAYITISVYTSTVSSNPAIAVDEEIAYTQVGALASGIKVNEQNLFGMEGYEKKGRMVTQISESSTDDQYPSAKAVYAALSNALGTYVDAVDALIGGGG